MANLCESACNIIGANGLLARVGCYYHDIGKLTTPGFFVENQGGGPNPHDMLPSDSNRPGSSVGTCSTASRWPKWPELPPVGESLYSGTSWDHGDNLFSHAGPALRDKRQGELRATTVTPVHGRSPPRRRSRCSPTRPRPRSACSTIPRRTRCATRIEHLVQQKLASGQLEDAPAHPARSRAGQARVRPGDVGHLPQAHRLPPCQRRHHARIPDGRSAVRWWLRPPAAARRPARAPGGRGRAARRAPARRPSR